MALCDDLRAQGHHLLTVDPRRPKQANLRRAISTAYYALFHLLLGECVARVSPRTPDGLAARIARSLAHTEMRDVCLSVSSRNPSAILKGLQPRGFSSELHIVATTFVELQDARNLSDYDLGAQFVRKDTLALIERTDEAFLAWRNLRKRDEATVFLMALLFARRWSR